MTKEPTKCDQCNTPTKNHKNKETGTRLCNDCRASKVDAGQHADAALDALIAEAIHEQQIPGQMSIDDILMAPTTFADSQPVNQQYTASGEPIIEGLPSTFELPMTFLRGDPVPQLKLPPTPLPAHGHEVHKELIGVITDAIHQAPRTLQQMIGPSELGTQCLRCLAKKLMGFNQTRGDAWLPTIGSAIHTWLEQVLGECDCGWAAERKVTVGIIGNRIVRGTCDLYGKKVCVDWKVTGKNTLDTTKRSGPSQTYRIQAHLYARGYELMGYEVSDVAILYLPRNSPSLADSVFWIESYDRDIALSALERADYIYTMVSADQSKILELPRADGCYDCWRMPQLPGEDAASTSVLPKQGNPFDGILLPS